MNNIKKYKDVEWIVLQSTQWNLHSTEKGIVKQINVPQNIWQWESLVHDKIKFVGFASGGTVTPDDGSGTPSFVPGTPKIQTAGMWVRFTVKYEPLNNCPLINQVIGTYTIAYANGIFVNAKP